MRKEQPACQTLGIIGGLGPLATACFYELIVRMTAADCDQEHLPVLIYSRPQIADRTRYILDSTQPSPVPDLIETGRKLTDQGASVLAMPCITAHYFFDSLQAALPVPLVNLVTETLNYLKVHQIRKIGLLATDGTLSSGLFQTAARQNGLTIITPDPERQQDIMRIIYDNIKAERPVDWDRFWIACRSLSDQGAESILLACTELSLLKHRQNLGPGFTDAMAILARSAILACGASLRDGHDLIIHS